MPWNRSLPCFPRLSARTRQARPRPQSQPLLYRPRIETLEKRVVPIVHVTNLLDSGIGSLRDALTRTQDGMIDFTPGLRGTITLSSATLVISQNTTIIGPGADQITISGNNNFQIFYDSYPCTFAVSGLTFANGVALIPPADIIDFVLPPPAGGAIFNVVIALKCDANFVEHIRVDAVRPAQSHILPAII